MGVSGHTLLGTRRAFLASAASVVSAFALPARPKLMVLLVAEQFRSDYFDSHASSLSAGGFKRLLAGGAYFPNCFQQAASFTSTGLATIATGAFPSTHGIVAERWYDRSGTPATHAIASAQADFLEATTFPARFLSADPRNRVFGMGFESRVTRILTGVTPYTPENAKSFAPDISAKQAWTAMGSTAVTPPTPMRTIDPADSRNFVALWRSSPLGQEAQFKFSRELISGNKLGRGDGVDLLCMVLGSLGSLGLETGANSPLVFDMVSQLDAQVESLLKFLDDTVGENSYQLVFTAAHGLADSAAHRVAAKEIAANLAKNFDLEAYIYPFLYLRSGDPVAAVKSIPQAAAWYTASGACSHTGLIRRRLRNSFHPRRCGDAMIAYAPSVAEDFANGRGVSYGSIYNYDAQVPLILFGPQFRAVEIEDSIELTDIAPTLCRALGAGLPSTSSGRVLGQAFVDTRK
jgi:predicted AlkP superfamily pyrophosphatase or phosphodiesterase